MKRILFFLALMMIAITASAEEYTTGGFGGQGGNPFRVGCPTGKVLVGIVGKAGAYIDSLQAVCVALNVDGTWAGSAAPEGGIAGGQGGAAYDYRCPANTAVVAIAGRASNFVDQLKVGCRGLGSFGKITGQTTTWLTPVGGTTGYEVGASDCVSRPGKGFAGLAYAWLDYVRLVCEVPPLGPNLLGPDHDKVIEYPGTAGVNFQWTTAPGAAKYRLCLGRVALNDTNCGPTSVAYNDVKQVDLTGTQKTVYPGDLAGFFGRQLYWRVVGIAASGGGSARELRFLMIHYPNATLVGPDHNSTVTTRKPTFRWNAVSGVNYYRLRYYDLNSGSSTPVDKDIGASFTQYTPTADLPATRIFWMINACGFSGCGSTGDIASNTARNLTIGGGTTLTWSTPLTNENTGLTLGTHLLNKTLADIINSRPIPNTNPQQYVSGRTDGDLCTRCHKSDGSGLATRYRPLAGEVAPTTWAYTGQASPYPGSYKWSYQEVRNPPTTGPVTQASPSKNFCNTTTPPKPADLCTIFTKWLTEGAQP